MKSKNKMIEITNFSIKNLFGYMNVTIPITDNKIVLSGINGTGKTTILTMLFYIMTGDWIKLSSFDFEKISITINNKKEEITYKALEENFFKRSKKLKKFKEEFFSDNQVKDIYALILEKSLQKDEIKNLITDNFLSLVENPKDIPKDVIAEQIINIRNEFYYLSKENNYGNDI
ncbi:MAG: putative ATP-binding protein involved in virulence, partial [Alphaproteobacteria bacterium]